MGLMGYLLSRRRLIYADAILHLVLMHCFGMQLCFAFSIHLAPNDELLDKHGTRSSSVNFESSSFQIHKRQNSKTATCTCTCETRPEDAEKSSTKDEEDEEEQLSSWNMHDSHDSDDILGGKTVDEPADQPEPKPSGAAAAASPATNRPLPANALETLDHNLKKLTADKVSELEAPDRYKESWRLGSPWNGLSSRTCYREPCTSDRDCCMDFNICDRSAHVCIDCWYGSSCMSQNDCCLKYPHCQHSSPHSQNVIGKCVNIK